MGDVGGGISIRIIDDRGEYAGYQSTYKEEAYPCFLLRNGGTFSIEINIDLHLCDAVQCHGAVQGKMAFKYILEGARCILNTPQRGYGSGNFVAVRVGDLKTKFGMDF